MPVESPLNFLQNLLSRGVGAGGAGGAAAPPMFLEINTGPPSGPPKIFMVH